jgi:hypothetical protein
VEIAYVTVDDTEGVETEKKNRRIHIAPNSTNICSENTWRDSTRQLVVHILPVLYQSLKNQIQVKTRKEKPDVELVVHPPATMTKTEQLLDLIIAQGTSGGLAESSTHLANPHHHFPPLERTQENQETEIDGVNR